jgi:ABC-type transport system involved in multi-copper enzyme maturation permease subunit
MASWWNLLMGVLVVLITCNEITYKTQRQNVIDGLSKRDIIIGKFLTFLLLAVFATLYTFLLALIFGIINDGMGDIASGISYIGIYLLQTIGYFSFAFLFAVLVKRPALAIIFYILIFMFRFIIGLIVGDYAAQFFPINVFGDLTPFPFFEQLFELAARSDPNFEEPVILSQSVRSFLAFTWISIFVMISYLVTKRRDI